MRVGLLTTYNEPCGLAEYAKCLVKSANGVEFTILDRDKWNLQDILNGEFDILHVNHEWQLFGWLTKSYIEQVKATGKKVMMTLHSSCSDNRNEYTQAFDRVIVHEKTTDGFTHIPMGIVELEYQWLDRDYPLYRTVGTSGFPIWHKRFVDIAAAAKMVRKHCFIVAPASRHADTYAVERQVMAVNPDTEYVTEYLPQRDVIINLNATDVLVYAMGNGPGISGSVRMGLAAKRPIVLTRCQQFHDLYDEYQDEVEFVDGEPFINPESIAAGINRVLKNGKKPKRILEDMGWSKVGKMYEKVYSEV